MQWTSEKDKRTSMCAVFWEKVFQQRENKINQKPWKLHQTPREQPACKTVKWFRQNHKCLNDACQEEHANKQKSRKEWIMHYYYYCTYNKEKEKNTWWAAKPYQKSRRHWKWLIGIKGYYFNSLAVEEYLIL